MKKKKTMLVALMLCSALSIQSTYAAERITIEVDQTVTAGGTVHVRGTSTQGGGAYMNNGTLNVKSGTTFYNNSSEVAGGAIYNNGGTLNIQDNVTFDNNFSLVDDTQGKIMQLGGAIYSQQNGTINIGNNVTFKNSRAGSGGAIYLYGQNTATIGNEASFINNKAFIDPATTGNNHGGLGGAISLTAHQETKQAPTLTIGDKAYFEANTAEGGGGAIAANAGSLTIGSDSQFINNSTSSNYGGAIYINSDTNVNIGDNALFSENSVTGASGMGGAVFNAGNFTAQNSTFTKNKGTNGGAVIAYQGTTNLQGSVFKENTATSGGGGIYNLNGSLNADGSTFINNTASSGGGMFSVASNFELKNATFIENNAKLGGAFYAYGATTITDSSFVNNSATTGGAIYALTDLTIKAENSDVIFIGNSAKDGADIYMGKPAQSAIAEDAPTTTGTLVLEAADGHSIAITDGVSGVEEFNMNLTGDGTVSLGGQVKNAQIDVQKGTLRLADTSFDKSEIKMSDNTTLDTADSKFNSYDGIIKSEENSNIKIKVDISSATGQTDVIGSSVKGTVTLEDFNPVSDTLKSSGSMTIEELRKSLGLSDGVTLDLGDAAKSDHIYLTPVRWLNASANENGISYSPTGNRYRDFNPAVMASSVGAQIGGYLTQLNSYDEAFRNMDMYMLLSSRQRQTLKNANKYAGLNGSYLFDNSNNNSLWVKPYSNFENVRLKNGPKVSNVAWGSFFGGDTGIMELGNGWDGMFGAYIGYNGSHQAYDGVSIYQNGATLGLSGMAYKNNFFTGITANIGSNLATADTRYGNEDFTLLMTGIASKSGYNWELADGKFIIQPSWLMSYSFINTFDYTNAAGVRVTSDPLQAIQLEPGIKFIGNSQKGWQPYAGLSIVWNILDKTQFQASDATLPELSVKPFFKYGFGLRKSWDERFSGYGQLYFTNGGRNGLGVQAGVKWAI